MSFTKQEWNNGTIYRVHVKQKTTPTTHIIDVPIDIAQSELVGKVFVGLEDMCLQRKFGTANEYGFQIGTQDAAYKRFWSKQSYLCFSAVQLPPDIDYISNEQEQTQQASQVFARVPLPQEYVPIRLDTVGNNNPADALYGLQPCVAVHRSLSKDGILTEMTNNPMGLGHGRLRIALLNSDGTPFRSDDTTDKYPIDFLSFTLVIYKPRNTYN